MDPATGLSAGEASARLERYGPNVLASAPPVPAWRKLLAQMADPLVYLLLGAVAVSGAVWVLEGADGVPFDVIVIVSI
ncbi:MAG: cation-transporting P-type ATPase, partial [Acidimicrobiia bacterium]|nr:cation-transporting P-type ATPase [Acidimicrobiia bacterium]